MNLFEKAEAVERVLRELDEEIQKFQSESALKCTFGCGRCCFKADIEATPLEFLPFAFNAYRQGRVEAWIDRLEYNSDEKVCTVLDPRQLGLGLCTEYQYRGLICRAFGFTARVNKYSRKELITCQVIKIEQPEEFKSVIEKINEDMHVPIASEYYSKLNYIDPVMSNQFMSINKAILRSMQLVWQDSFYRDQEPAIV